MSDPCQSLRFHGLLSVGERCGKPEDDPIHDPLGPIGAHVYDPNPADPAGAGAAEGDDHE